MSATAAAAATPTVARRILPLYPAVGASYFGYAMMATLFVPMLLSRTDGYLPAADSLARRTTVIGVLLILYPLGQFFGNSVLGGLSDRSGRRPLILVSSAATIVCYLGIASALEVRDLVLLAPFLLVCGVVEANTALAMSAIADVTSDADRPRYIAFVFAVTSVSYTIGPVVGGVLAQASGYAVPFWIVLAALVVVLAWLQFRFAETLPADRRQRPPLLRSLSGLSQVLTDRLLRRQYLANLLAFVAVMGIGRVVTIYLVDRWHLSVGQVAACYAILAVAAGSANLFVVPRLAGRVAMRTLALVCLSVGGLLAAAMTVPGAVGVPGALVLAIAVAAVGFLLLAAALAAVAAVLSAAAPPDKQGTVLGNNAALLVLGEVVGVSGGSFLAGVATALPLVVLGGIAVLAGGVMASGLPSRRPAGIDGQLAA